MECENTYIDAQGVEYSSDRKRLIQCPKDLSGAYCVIEGVEEIEYGAFNETSISSVILPKSLRVIGGEAFGGCEKLESVYFPSQLEEIGSAAFVGCKRLIKIELPSTLQYIGNDAFATCESLTEVDISQLSNIKYLAAFGNCTQLRSIKLPNNIEIIGRGAFGSCEQLESIILPNSLRIIKTHAFAGCKNIQKIEIPSLVTFIEPCAFCFCDNLHTISVDSRNTTFKAYNDVLFKDNILLCYPAGKKDLEYTTPNTTEHIEERAFEGNQHLITLTISEGVKSIKEMAFFCCHIVNLYLPKSISTIYDYALAECETLKHIYFNGIDSLIDLGNPFGDIMSNETSNIKVYIPQGTKTQLKWMFKTWKIQDAQIAEHIPLTSNLLPADFPEDLRKEYEDRLNQQSKKVLSTTNIQRQTLLKKIYNKLKEYPFMPSQWVYVFLIMQECGYYGEKKYTLFLEDLKALNITELPDNSSMSRHISTNEKIYRQPYPHWDFDSIVRSDIRTTAKRIAKITYEIL